jgi:hypothetical protein
MSDMKKSSCKGRGFEVWWEERSLPVKILVGIGFGILGVGFLALFGLLVMALWNWLMPEIFGIKRVDFWQACGLLLLASILFKGFHFKDENHRIDRKRRQHLRSYMREEAADSPEK